MVITCGYSDPLALASAFPEEFHGHGVTLVPLDTCMRVSAGALPK